MIAWAIANWRIVALAAAILAMTAALGVSRWQLNACRADAAQARAQVTVLGAQLAEQNAAVEHLASEGRARQERAKRLLAAAEADNAGARDEIARLEAKIAAPTPAGKGCRDALEEWRSGR